MSGYSPELAATICDAVAEGASLRTIAEREGMPSRRTMRGWLELHPEFERSFTIARRCWAANLEEELAELAGKAQQIEAEAAKAGVNENAAIAALRCEIDSKKWLLSKIAPSVYGDRISQEITGANGRDLIPEPLDTSKMALALLCVLNNAPGGRNDPARLEASQPLPAMPTATSTLLSGPLEPAPTELELRQRAISKAYEGVTVYGEPVKPVFDTLSGKVVRLDPREGD